MVAMRTLKARRARTSCAYTPPARSKLVVPDSGVGIEQWSQSSGSNVIPRRAGPGLAGLRPHKIAAPQAHPTRSGLSKSRDAGDSRVKCLVFSI
jgi:hypothetical protein